MDKKVFIIPMIIAMLVILVAGGFWYFQKAGQAEMEKQKLQQQIQQEEERKVEEERNNQETRGDLVWYEVPELGIRFKVDKEIANNIGHRDNYVEGGKSGYLLYVKDYPSQLTFDTISDSFAIIVSYANYRDDSHMRWAISCSGDECCPADPKIRKLLIKTDDKIVCYLDDSFSKEINQRNGIYQKLSPISKKLFNGYLKTVPTEEIKNTVEQIEDK